MSRDTAEFHIIGNIGSIRPREKVTYVRVAVKYSRKEGDEWTEHTRWNSVTCFGKVAEKAQKAGVGDLVRITGVPEETAYERGGETIYGTDLIAKHFYIHNRAGNSGDDAIPDAD